MISIKELLNTIPQVGKLEWIGIRTVRRGEVLSVESANLIQGYGIEGDHKVKKAIKHDSKRQITLIQAEHLPVIASIMKKESVDPKTLRRNLVVSGINLLALKNQQFYIGNILLEATGECHPCSRMEEYLGAGGYNAVRGHGGLTAKIISGGTINLGDPVYYKKITE